MNQKIFKSKNTARVVLKGATAELLLLLPHWASAQAVARLHIGSILSVSQFLSIRDIHFV